MKQKIRQEIEAAAFRGLVNHLQKRTDVQNIDLMNLAGFCRNCLSKWFMSAANEREIGIDYEQAREIIYGVPYSEWKKQFQSPSSEKQKKTFEETKALHAVIEGLNTSKV